MKKKLEYIGILFLFIQGVTAQSDSENETDQNRINHIEDFILSKQLDSIGFYISKVENKTSYLNLLTEIAAGSASDYKEQSKFINKISNRANINYEAVSNYINENIEVPQGKKTIDIEYATIKISQIARLRNDGDLDKASLENVKLGRYINRFDQTDKDVILAKAHASSHTIVMHYIQRDLEKGKDIINKNLEIADQYGDKILTIASLYYLSDFLVLDGKLLEYIDANEQCLEIEKKLKKTTEYHLGILIHLIDSYIYKGGHENRVQELLNELYNDPNTKAVSFSLYAKYLGTLPSDSAFKKEIFKKLGVSNTKEFAELAVKETKEILNPNNYFFVLKECATTLEKDNYLKEALRYKEEAMQVNTKVYSEDLSKSLAAFQTEQAVKIKDIEIETQKSRSKLYMITGLAIVLLFLASLFFLIKSLKQAKTLKEKNEIIDQSLKEKELLVKEVHHRVKNNFQIVSSLLELQSKGIEDEKARELAIDGKNRVKSMALIHQRLYQNDSGLIDFDLYIKELVQEISNIYHIDAKVETNVDVKNVAFDVDTAIPLGLIINELITNSYKYAFAKAETPQLDISLVENKESYILKVKDNGAGMNPDFDFTKAKSLGLRLVKRLTKQLQGSVEISSLEGTVFEISFKDTLQRKMVD